MDEIKKTRQQRQILEMLEAHPEGVTAKCLNDTLHMTDARKRISELREKKVPIIDAWAYGENEDGVKTKWKVYKLDLEAA